MASSNPALNDAIFEREMRTSSGGSAAGSSPASELPTGLFGGQTGPGASTLPPVTGETMRLSGTMSASAILLGFLLVAGYFGWQAVTGAQSPLLDLRHQVDCQSVREPLGCHGKTCTGQRCSSHRGTDRGNHSGQVSRQLYRPTTGKP